MSTVRSVVSGPPWRFDGGRTNARWRWRIQGAVPSSAKRPSRL